MWFVWSFLLRKTSSGLKYAHKRQQSVGVINSEVSQARSCNLLKVPTWGFLCFNEWRMFSIRGSYWEEREGDKSGDLINKNWVTLECALNLLLAFSQQISFPYYTQHTLKYAHVFWYVRMVVVCGIIIVCFSVQLNILMNYNPQLNINSIETFPFTFSME